MTKNTRSTLRLFFVSISTGFLVFISQFLLWRNADIADFDYWVYKMEDLRLHLQNLDFIFSEVPSHFGTFVTLTGAAFRLVGLNPRLSLLASIITIDSLIILALIFVSYRLRPKSMSYIWVGIPFIFNKYVASNPLDIAISGLLSIIYLIIFLGLQKSRFRSKKLIFILGAFLGLAGATRIHLTLILGVPSIFYLLPRIGWKRLALRFPLVL